MWLALGGLAIFGVLAITVVQGHRSTPFALDATVNTWIATDRQQSIIVIAEFLAAIGAGSIIGLIVPGVIVIVLALSRRWREAVIFVTASLLSAIAVQVLKAAIHRDRPGHGVVYEPPWSFPSGHAAQAATVVVVLMLLLRKRWVMVIGTLYAVAMAASRVYLGVHWVTDVVAGLLFGASAAVVLFALSWLVFRQRRVGTAESSNPQWLELRAR